MKVNIDNLLKHKNKTRYWLAKQIGIAYPNLMKLANNETTSVKFEIIEQICSVLECTPNDLLILSPITHG